VTFTALGLVFLLIFATAYFMYSFGLTISGSPKLVFRPVNLFCIQFSACFIVPLVVVFIMSVPIPGLPYMSRVYANRDVIRVIVALIVFLFVVCGTFICFRPKALHRMVIDEPSREELAVAGVLFAVGTACSIYLGHSFSEGPRSDLVKTISGQILYGLTFLQTAGFMIIALHLAIKRKYVSLVCISIVFALPLFLLGGRGRVLWPFVVLTCSYMAFSGRMISKLYIASGFALLIVAIVVMDPLLAWLRLGGSMNDLPAFDSLFYEVYLAKRNFDGFYNFSVIVYYDEVPHSARYLIRGVRDVFMGTYFPDVYEKGYAFPATVPGTMWLVRGFSGLVVGSVIYGLLLVVLEKVYWGACSAAAFSLVFYVSTIITNPGNALIEDIGKILVSALAFSPYFIFRKAVRFRRASVAFNRPRKKGASLTS
jgi:hypothetical protein